MTLSAFNIFRRQHWIKGLTFLIILTASLAIFTTYAVLTESSIFGHQKEGARHIFLLLYVDLVLMGLLTLMIGWRVYLMWRRRKRQNLMGSKLHVQLVSVFCTLAAIPALIMAIFSIIFIQFSLQSWFGDRISMAVKESRIVAQAYLEEHQKAVGADILGMANDLNREAVHLNLHHDKLQNFINTQTMLRNLSEAVLVNSDKDIIARSGLSFSIGFLPEDFDQKIDQADKGEVVLFVGEQEDRVRALVKMDNYFDTYLFVGRLVDEAVLEHIDLTKQATDAYSLLEQRQSQLKIAISSIFLFVAILLLLLAIWAGLTLAERLVTPIMRLVRATEKIGSGDLNIRVEEDHFENELTTLGRTFNSMTDQLANQRRDLVQVNQQLEERRHFIEAVLGGVNAGVMGLDIDGTIIVANQSAQTLLRRSDNDLIGKKLVDIAPEIETIRRVLRRKQSPQIEMEMDMDSLDAAQPPHWVVRMSADINSETIRGYVATFDDISPLVDAQKKAAWADVARRVAHEIKNPLTPIQLSAERLKRRYGPQITDGKETFDLCTDTITRQVDDIRRMIDEFSTFARMPQAQKKNENLVTISREVLILYQQSHHKIKFITDYPDHPVTIFADRQQIRQALLNLIKNAIEAMDDLVHSDEQQTITIRIQQQDTTAMIQILDNGHGFSPDVLARAAEPYVTTKEYGSGLGLSIVTNIIHEHHGTLKLDNHKPRGAQITISLPLAEKNKD
jgi:two-component system nitrogen regulation sensor histidine kinase NtrY